MKDYLGLLGPITLMGLQPHDAKKIGRRFFINGSASVNLSFMKIVCYEQMSVMQNASVWVNY